MFFAQRRALGRAGLYRRALQPADVGAVTPMSVHTKEYEGALQLIREIGRGRGSRGGEGVRGQRFWGYFFH